MSCGSEGHKVQGRTYLEHASKDSSSPFVASSNKGGTWIATAVPPMSDLPGSLTVGNEAERPTLENNPANRSISPTAGNLADGMQGLSPNPHLRAESPDAQANVDEDKREHLDCDHSESEELQDNPTEAYDLLWQVAQDLFDNDSLQEESAPRATSIDSPDSTMQPGHPLFENLVDSFNQARGGQSILGTANKESPSQISDPLSSFPHAIDACLREPASRETRQEGDDSGLNFSAFLVAAIAQILKTNFNTPVKALNFVIQASWALHDFAYRAG